MKSAYWMVVLLLGIALQAQDKKTFSTDGMELQEGFFDYWWSEEKGKLFLLVDKLDEEFLYVNSLAAGMGSNDIGLDRGQLGSSRVVRFYRSGPKILMIQPNYDFRASSENEEERKSVEEAFAQSVLAGFDVVGEQKGHPVIDITSFVVRDAHSIAGRLKSSEEGSYSLDNSRSTVFRERCKNFPMNSEFEALLTFGGKPTGKFTWDVVPTANSISLRVHHSFVALPKEGYQMRKYDPRCGLFSSSYKDYSVPIQDDLIQRFIVRHRLEKVNPDAAMSPAKEPLIYYLDRGAPEPIKSALIEGASWWNQAFEAAGFEDAFQVKVLPEGVDPLDVRYNVIQWVHRSTRGWSYGASVVDPRTGEIIKGHISLGSLRVRQDYLLALGLAGRVDKPGGEDDELLQLALARLRQLSAHEVGHTLGLAHNFAASPKQRASVMDYPHPYVTIDENGTADFSEAYATGIGDWDKIAVRYAYSQYENEKEEKAGLKEILTSYSKEGYQYISDSDARASGGAHPSAHLWDNGDDAIAELARISKIRKNALEKLDVDYLKDGQPLAELEDILAPIYLSQRYQIKAVSKLIGGLKYSYAVKGADFEAMKVVSEIDQKRALREMMKCTEPSFLRIPDKVLSIIPPRPPGYWRGREHFPSKMAPLFDPFAAAITATEMTLDLLLHPTRLNRMTNFHALGKSGWSTKEYLDELHTSLWNASANGDYEKEILRNNRELFLIKLLGVHKNSKCLPGVRDVLREKIDDVRFSLSNKTSGFSNHLRNIIDNHFTNFKLEVVEEKTKIPDGSPIGCSIQH